MPRAQVLKLPLGQGFKSASEQLGKPPGGLARECQLERSLCSNGSLPKCLHEEQSCTLGTFQPLSICFFLSKRKTGHLGECKVRLLDGFPTQEPEDAEQEQGMALAPASQRSHWGQGSVKER